MIYKFRSKATGDLIMLGPDGDHIMGILGREPAAQGIIEVPDMPAAVAALRAAVAAEGAGAAEGADDERPRAVGLRQRAWPLIEMIERARAAEEPVIWGA